MEGSKNHKSFETEWAAAFEGAEMQPSTQVWKNITGELAAQQVSAYRKKAFKYQMLAAASVMFAVGLSVVYFFNNSGDVKHQAIASANTQESVASAELPATATTVVPLADQDNPASGNIEAGMISPVDGTSKAPNVTRHLQVAQIDQQTKSKDGAAGNRSKQRLAESSKESLTADTHNVNEDTKAIDQVQIATLIASNEAQEKPQSIILIPANNVESNQMVITENSMLSYLDAKYAPLDHKITPKALPEFFYRIPIYNFQEVKAEEIADNKFWAGVNFGSGTFNPNFGAPKSINLSAVSARETLIAQFITPDNQTVPLVEETRTGVSYTVGVEVGKKIAPRWILQTGLQYGIYGATGRTNQTYWDGNPESSYLPISFQNQIDLYSQRALIINNDNIAVDNRFQLLAVPVKMGFVLLDTKVNVLLNAGISGDFYLGNRLSSNAERIGNYNFSPGSDSPYRNVHLTGITGIQVGYRIGDNYYLSVEPHYRQSLTEFTKTGQPYSSTPSRMGVAMGFRYNF